MWLISVLFPIQFSSFQSEILIMKRTGMSLSKPLWPISFIIQMQLLWSSYSMELSEYDAYHVHFRIFEFRLFKSVTTSFKPFRLCGPLNIKTKDNDTVIFHTMTNQRCQHCVESQQGGNFK